MSSMCTTLCLQYCVFFLKPQNYCNHCVNIIIGLYDTWFKFAKAGACWPQRLHLIWLTVTVTDNNKMHVSPSATLKRDVFGRDHMTSHLSTNHVTVEQACEASFPSLTTHTHTRACTLKRLLTAAWGVCFGMHFRGMGVPPLSCSYANTHTLTHTQKRVNFGPFSPVLNKINTACYHRT